MFLLGVKMLIKKMTLRIKTKSSYNYILLNIPFSIYHTSASIEG